MSRLRSVFRRNRLERELDAELRFHLDQQIHEKIAAGMSKAEAQSAAWRSMGGIAQVKEELLCSEDRHRIDPGTPACRDITCEKGHYAEQQSAGSEGCGIGRADVEQPRCQ